MRRVKPQSPEVSSQLDRAWARVVSNTAEAASRRGRNKGRNRFDDALGEAKESHGLLRYVYAADMMPPDSELLRRFEHQMQDLIKALDDLESGEEERAPEVEELRRIRGQLEDLRQTLARHL